jgi:hypothetical protein
MFIVDVVEVPNWTTVPPDSALVGTPPDQLPAVDQLLLPPAPVHVWVDASAGAALSAMNRVAPTMHL